MLRFLKGLTHNFRSCESTINIVICEVNSSFVILNKVPVCVKISQSIFLLFWAFICWDYICLFVVLFGRSNWLLVVFLGRSSWLLFIFLGWSSWLLFLFFGWSSWLLFLFFGWCSWLLGLHSSFCRLLFLGRSLFFFKSRYFIVKGISILIYVVVEIFVSITEPFSFCESITNVIV